MRGPCQRQPVGPQGSQRIGECGFAVRCDANVLITRDNPFCPARGRLCIVAAFDANDTLIGTTNGGKPIMHLSRLGEVCQRYKIKIGIITVPAEYAQGVCDLLIENGILAIWNFAPKHLNVPDGILVQNENMAASLALLCKHLNERMQGQDG